MYYVENILGIILASGYTSLETVADVTHQSEKPLTHPCNSVMPIWKVRQQE